MTESGRLLVLLGACLVLAGLVMTLAGRLHVPGDVAFRRGGFSVFAPLGTMLLVSIILTLLLNLFFRIGR